MSTSSVGSSTSSTGTQTASSSGLNLSSSDFVTMMIKQLQSQDPLNPTNSDQLMSQMSAIGQMQSSTQLQTTLSGLAQQTQIGAASGLIGKVVSGIDSTNNTVSGLVTSVQVTSSGANLQLDSGSVLPLSNVSTVAPATGSSVTATKSA